MSLQLKRGTDCLLKQSAICCFLSLVCPPQAKFEPATACRLQVSLYCAVLCHIVSLQYLSRSSLHRLAGLHCRIFLPYGIQVGTRGVHRSSLRRLICPAQDHFIVLILRIIYRSIYMTDVPITLWLQTVIVIFLDVDKSFGLCL